MTTLSDPTLSPQAQADAWLRDSTLAQSKGDSVEQRLARQRVARLFCEIHMPNDTAAQRDGRLAVIDFTQTVVSTNARGIDVNNAKAKGFLGMGRKRVYLLSERLPPKNDADPIYALEYTSLKR